MGIRGLRGQVENGEEVLGTISSETGTGLNEF